MAAGVGAKLRCARFKPYLLMTLAQLGYTILYFITEASFNNGLNTYVYITYRHLVSAMIMWPFAYFLERKLRPTLTWALFLEINILSVLGVSLTLNMYFTSLKYTSPTFVSSIVNTVVAMTFLVAVVLRMERLNIRSTTGMAKVLGTILSLAGVTTITLYKGPAMKSIFKALIHLQGSGTIKGSWVKGSILAVASCISWPLWYIMQAITLKRYPAQLSLTAWMSLLGGIQSAVFTAIIEHRPEAWTVKFDINFWSILYAGVVVSGLIVYIQLWCTKEKGPVFVTMFNPLCTVMVALLAYFVFGEKLYLGSIIGAIVVIVGLYTVLWGQEEEHEQQRKLEESFSLGNVKENDENQEISKQTGIPEDKLKGFQEV